MNPSEVVNACFSAIEKKDFTKADKLMSDRMEVNGVSPRPLSKKEFLNVHRALSSGMPDFKFHHKIFEEEGNRIGIKVRITGTHTKEMTAPIPGIKNIPATGKAVSMPEEEAYLTVKDGKIIRMELEKVPGGGLPGILKQIGAKIPEPAIF